MSRTFTLNYKIFGDPENPCIILITGIGGQLIDWPDEFIQKLRQKGFYVVAFDNRDSGLSRYYDEFGIPNLQEAVATKHQGKPFHPPYTIEDMAKDVIALMDELKVSKAHICGISFGGMVAQSVAINYPNRVLSLICISTTSSDPRLPPAKKEVLDYFTSSLHSASQNQSLEIIIHKKLQLFKIYYHPDYFNEDKIKKQLMRAYKRAHYPNGFKRLLLAMICAEPRTDRLKKLKIPALIIHGDYDPVFSVEHGKQLAESIPCSHLEIIKKMGHGFPDYFAYIIADLIIKYFKDES